MGSDPILAQVPAAVSAGLVICLIALVVTAGPILAGKPIAARRLRQATWGSWACLAGVLLALFVELAPGLYGFITLVAITAAAAATLWRARALPTT